MHHDQSSHMPNTPREPSRPLICRQRERQLSFFFYLKGGGGGSHDYPRPLGSRMPQPRLVLLFLPHPPHGRPLSRACGPHGGLRDAQLRTNMEGHRLPRTTWGRAVLLTSGRTSYISLLSKHLVENFIQVGKCSFQTRNKASQKSPWMAWLKLKPGFFPRARWLPVRAHRVPKAMSQFPKSQKVP